MRSLKILIFLLVLIMASTSVFGQTITIDKPLPGMDWKKGISYQIKWTSSGQMINTVKIRLMDKTGLVKVLGIIDSTDNDGSYDWIIPTTLTSDDYVMRVRTTNNSVTGNSGVFTISVNQPAPPPKSITITSPPKGITWNTGKGYNIDWDTEGIMVSKVNITLMNSALTHKAGDIATNTSNDKNYFWTIPATVSNGDYKIKIVTTDGQVTGVSGKFTIKKKTSGINPLLTADVMKLSAKLTITKPDNNDEWKKGKSYNIRWKNMYTKGYLKNIQLFDKFGNQLLRIIAILPKDSPKVNVSGDNSSYSWKIQEDIKADDYRIKISVVDGTLKPKGLSAKFRIKEGVKVEKYTIRGSVDNRYKYYYWLGNNKYPLKHTTQQGTIPVPGTMKIGYKNHTTSDRGGQYIGFIYRSFVKFNINHLKGKGLLLSAKIVYNRHKATAHCPVRMYFIESNWTDPFNVNAGYLSNPDNQLTLSAQKWFAPGNNNFGVMFTGADESYQHNNNSCVAFTYVVDLELEFLTSD